MRRQMLGFGVWSAWGEFTLAGCNRETNIIGLGENAILTFLIFGLTRVVPGRYAGWVRAGCFRFNLMMFEAEKNSYKLLASGVRAFIPII